MDTDERFMGEALKEAKHSLKDRLLPVGAVLVKSGKILARGRKRGEVHFAIDHAEKNACEEILSLASAKLDGIIVYTTMEPCLMCMGLLLNLRVERIVYAIEDPYGGGTGILRPDALPRRHTERHPFLRGGVLRTEAKDLLKNYFKNVAPPGIWKNKKNPLVKMCLE
jgi:tRNA(adenine34) deaminase